MTMYEHFFGLHDEPFRLTPDPRYLYLSAKHAEALAHLRLGLSETTGFVCITGEVGTGKTTLLRAFLGELGPDVTAAYTLVPPRSTLDLLVKVCRDFGLATSGSEERELIDALHGYLVAQHEAGRVCVVVIDEAQALSAELLEQVRLLLNLETETHKLLRIVLVGQPQLRKLLLDPELKQLNQRITLRWHLQTLSYRETVAYVRHRLAVASGSQDACLFTRPALRLLHSAARGVPRLVNMIAHRALLAAFLDREPLVTRRFVARAYREIQAVPLPGTMSPVRKTTWATVGLAVGAALVALGGPRVERLLTVITPPAATSQAASSRPSLDQHPPAIHESVAARAEPPVPVDPPVVAAANPTTTVPPPADPTPTSVTAAPTPASPEALASADELAERLATIDLAASARTATQGIFTAWGACPSAAEVTRLPDELESAAWRCGLQALSLPASRKTLRVLDLPAVLPLQVPGKGTRRWATLTAIDGSRAVLSIGGESTTIDAALLDRFASGQVYVLWRDFEALGSELSTGARGIAVVRLQELLRRAGAYSGEPTGVFDARTEEAVIAFQNAHMLEPDGVVGRRTRIVLYATAGGYTRPALAIAKDAS